MRTKLSVVGVVLVACAGGGSDASSAAPSHGDASSAEPEHGDASSAALERGDASSTAPALDEDSGARPAQPTPGTPGVDAGSTASMHEEQAEAGTASSDDEGDVADDALPRTAAFHVLEPLGSDLVGDDPLTTVQGFMELHGGGAESVFGVSSALVTDASGVRIGAQVFRWSPEREVITLDDETPWKRLHLADPAGRWLVGERGSGSGTAQAFVWREDDGLEELSIGNGLPVLVTGVSSDGSVVVGDAQGNAGWQVYRWTDRDGARFLELPDGHTRSGASSLSADGSTVFGTTGAAAESAECHRWVGLSAPQLLEHAPSRDGWERAACGVTPTPAADGSATGGTVSYLDPSAPTSKARWQAFHWSEQTGMSYVELPGFAHTQALVTSQDGRAVYGQALVDTNSTPGAQPFRWTVESGAVPLGIPEGGRDAHLLAAGVLPRSGISDDGQTVVGNSRGGTARGFVWSASGGLVTLRPLAGHAETEVTHLDASGRVAAGVSIGAEVEAVLWDAAGEPRSIRALLEEAGVEIGAFDFGGQYDHDVAVFDDGKRVLGVGKTEAGIAAAWVAILP